MSQSNSNGSGWIGTLGVAFIVLKLTGVITWSWWWVLAPFWGGFLLVIIILLIVAILKTIFD